MPRISYGSIVPVDTTPLPARPFEERTPPRLDQRADREHARRVRRASSRLGLVERERGRQLAVGVDLLPAFGELVLSLRERVGAGDESERRLLLGSDGQQRLGEL